jgi:hypothetical protein
MPGRGIVKHRAQTEDFVKNALGYFALEHFGKSEVPAVAREKGDNVCVAVEARAFRSDVVCHD